MSLSSEAHANPHAFTVHVAHNGLQKTFDVTPHEHVSVLFHHTLHAFGVHDRPHAYALFRTEGDKIPNDVTVHAAGIGPDATLLLREKPEFEIHAAYNGVPKTFDEVKPNEQVSVLLQRVLLAFGIRDRPHAYALYLVDGDKVTEIPNDVTVHAAGIRPGATLILREKIVGGGDTA